MKSISGENIKQQGDTLNSDTSTTTTNPVIAPSTSITVSTPSSSIVLKSCPPYLTRTPSESHSISLSNQHLLYYLHHKKNSRKKRISAPVFRTVNTPANTPNISNISNSRNMIILRSRKSWPVEELRVKSFDIVDSTLGTNVGATAAAAIESSVESLTSDSTPNRISPTNPANIYYPQTSKSSHSRRRESFLYKIPDLSHSSEERDDEVKVGESAKTIGEEKETDSDEERNKSKTTISIKKEDGSDYVENSGSKESDVLSLKLSPSGIPHTPVVAPPPTPQHPPTGELIVTPFAQILASLRNIRYNYIMITEKLSPGVSGHAAPEPLPESADITDPELITSTLEELDWCLEQLENLQTHRSVSDMASSKFKKLLNKELNSKFNNSSDKSKDGQNGNQISQFLLTTYLDKDQENDDTNYDEDDNNQESVTKGNNNNSESAAAPSNVTPASASSSKSPSVASFAATTVSSSIVPIVSPSDLPQLMTTIPGIKQVGPVATTSSSLLKYGVEVKDEKSENAIDEVLSNLHAWGSLNIFTLNELSNGRPLTVLMFKIFEDLCTSSPNLGILLPPKNVLLNYFTSLESHYHPPNLVPYHNSLHAADVVQSTYFLLNSPALKNVFTNLEIFAALFAAAIHDADHPGVTNNYLINTASDLSLMYNDVSILENHHLAVGFKLLFSTPNSDIFEKLSKKQRSTLRKLAIDIVLATDMSKHMKLLGDLKTMVESKKVMGGGIVIALEKYEERSKVLQNLVHCSDLSNPTKPLQIYKAWTSRIMEEFYRQGDKERELGLGAISPMCDRIRDCRVERVQVGFIDYIVHPLWETWSDLVYPDCSEILDTLEENRNYYLRKEEEGQESPPILGNEGDSSKVKFKLTLDAEEEERGKHVVGSI